MKQGHSQEQIDRKLIRIQSYVESEERYQEQVQLINDRINPSKNLSQCDMDMNGCPYPSLIRQRKPVQSPLTVAASPELFVTHCQAVPLNATINPPQGLADGTTDPLPVRPHPSGALEIHRQALAPPCGLLAYSHLHWP